MSTNGLISARWRVMGPLALAGAGLLRRMPAGAQEQPQRAFRDDPLTSLLSLAPVSAAGSAENAQIATFADMAAQLAAGGIAPPTSIDDDEAMRRWIHASYPITLADPFRTMAMTLDRSLIGYDVTDLDQTLEAGEPPEMITLLRGRFDQARVAAAWGQNGYKQREVQGITVASLFEDAQIDPSIEISRLALARMNNAAFLPDGTLAYAATLGGLTEVIALANGARESLADRVDIATLIGSLEEPLVSALLVPGAQFSLAAQLPPFLLEDKDAKAEIDAQLAATGELPPIALGLVGITAGGPTVIMDEGEEPLIEMPPATIVYRLLMATPGSAEAAATVVDKRLDTMSSMVDQRPYADLFGSWEANAVGDGTILALDLLPPEGSPVSRWIQPLLARDLLFLAW